MAAIITAGLILVFLLGSIVYSSLPAFSHHHVRLDINLSEDYVSADAPEDGNYLGLVRAALRDHFPQVTGGVTNGRSIKSSPLAHRMRSKRASKMIRASSARKSAFMCRFPTTLI